MTPDQAPLVSAHTTMEEYRKDYNEKQKHFWRRENLPLLRKQFMGIEDVIVRPRSVDMREFRGDEKRLQQEIEFLYANDGR